MANAYRSTSDVIIRTKEWPAAVNFYRSVLRLPVVQQSETMIGFDTGGFRLFVEKGEEHGPVFEFLVSNVQDAKRLLVSAGCTVQEEDASVPRCYIRDPFGFVFNLCQQTG